MAEAANRGKKPEAEVKKVLEAHDAKTAAFDWHRNYDAHTAGGRFPRQVGDFEFYAPGVHGIIEVKEVNHACRLPHKNFNTDAVAKLRKRRLAGGYIYVMVYFTPLDQWRILHLDRFLTRDGGSWDLSDAPLYPSAAAAMYETGVLA